MISKLGLGVAFILGFLGCLFVLRALATIVALSENVVMFIIGLLIVAYIASLFSGLIIISYKVLR